MFDIQQPKAKAVDNFLQFKPDHWASEELSDQQKYQSIVFNLLRTPERLESHLQRIYLCYQCNMQQPLYAALIDLLWILDGKGHGLARRMIKATHALLSKQQKKVIKNYFKHQNKDSLPANKYTVCTSGRFNHCRIIGQQNVETSHVVEPLRLARDFIEYSQLEQALNTLENAIYENPKDVEIVSELIELLKVTDDKQAFNKIDAELKNQEIHTLNEWQTLADFFAKQEKE